MNAYDLQRKGEQVMTIPIRNAHLCRRVQTDLMPDDSPDNFLHRAQYIKEQ
jgi:hypothetical protein